jgi:AraC family transcriptional regulator, regulatory protein of adaptative response / methylated-DNA-[protein]-cysteine methyltransferase
MSDYERIAKTIAFIGIPCHRVIQRSGAFGGYRWGAERKVAMQAWGALECRCRQSYGVI